jgi:sphingomyelin phosphodiesterase
VHRNDHTRYRWWSDVNSYPTLDGQIKSGPTYSYEYSTREAYGTKIPWGANDPLNATWWHHVTERVSCLAYPLYFSSDFLFRLQKWRRTLVSFRCESLRIFVVNQLMFPVKQSTFTNFQGKQSVRTIPCNTTQCIQAKICYMRSGSASLAVQNCQSGFGSVQ